MEKVQVLNPQKFNDEILSLFFSKENISFIGTVMQIIAFIAVQVFKLISRKVLIRNSEKVGCFFTK